MSDILTERAKVHTNGVDGAVESDKALGKAGETAHVGEDAAVPAGDEFAYDVPKRRRWRVIVPVVLIAALLVTLGFFLFRSSRTIQTATVRRGTIISSVETTGKLEAARRADLAFKQSGRIERVLVEEGKFVEVGAVLAELDTSALRRQLSEAQTQLEISKLRLQQAKDGPRPSDIAAATADLDAALSRLNSVKAGGRAEDIAGAQSALNGAQSKLDAIKKGPSPQEITAVQAQLDGAKANRDLVTSNAANTKEQARLQLQTAEKALADGKGTQTQIDQARGNYETAKDNEAAQLSASNALVREAQAALDRVKAGATADELRQAEEAVAQARANLDKVKSGATPDEIAEAQSRVDAARAALDRVKAGPTSTDIAILEQGIALTQLSVDNVNAQIEESRLVAPLSGTLLKMDLQVGETVNGFQPVAAIADVSTLRIRADIDEIDVGRVSPSQPVTVTLDAYPGVLMPGKIETVSPGATQKQGSTVYAATILFTPTGEVVPREGMAANVDITAQRKDGVLLLPNRAFETVGQSQFVQISEGNATRKVEVETGLSNRTDTEIISGLSEGQSVVLR